MTVLVTGGSGYIGGWCIASLLDRGYEVRTTIRDLAREAEVRKALANVTRGGDRLSFRAASLTDDAGWSEAVEGCQAVLHVASPVPQAQPKRADDLIRPARDGALRLLRAAMAGGVQRVVMTSSVAAVASGASVAEGTYDETSWTNLKGRGVTPYAQSKTIAERAAWDLMAQCDTAMTLATVNPALVLGPVMSADFSASVEVVRRMVAGQMPGLPRLGFNVVDVKTIVQSVLCLGSPDAVSQII